MISESKLPARAWLIVGLLCVVGALNYLDRIMLTTMRGSIMAAMPMTDAQFGLLTAVFLWVYALLSPFAGFLADRFNRSHVIVVSLFLWSAVTWMTAHATTFEQLLVTRALMGVSEAAYLPAALALITDYHRGSTRSLATGVHIAGIMIGSGMGGIGGWMAEHHNWTYAFTFFGIVGIVYSVVLAVLLRDAPQNQVEANPTVGSAKNVRFLEALKSLLSRRSFGYAIIFWGLLGLVGWTIAGWLPTFLKEHFHLSQSAAGFSATGYIQAAGLIGVLAGGVWADHWSRTHPRGRILVPAIGLCLAAPGIFLASSTTVLPIAVAGLVLYGLTRTFTDANMMPILCLVTDPRYRATGYGVITFVNGLLGGSSVYLVGMLRDRGFGLDKVFMSASVAILVCAGLLLLIKPRPDAAEEAAHAS